MRKKIKKEFSRSQDFWICDSTEKTILKI